MRKILKINFWLLFFVCFASSFFSLSVSAASPIRLTSDVGDYAIGLSIDVLEDIDGELTIDDVSSKAYDSEFIASDKIRPGYGFTNSAYWVRFNVLDESVDNKWFLQLSYPPLDYVDLYSDDNQGGFTSQKSGDLRPFSGREIKNNYFVFPLSVDKRERTFFLRVESRGSISIPLSILSDTVYAEAVGFNNYFQGAYIGIMLVMTIYNLFVFLSVRDRSYLFYVLFIANMGLFQMSMAGYSGQFLWPEWVWWGNVSTIFSVSLSVGFAYLFSQSFLNTKIYSPNTHMALTVLSVIALVNAGLSFVIPYKISALVIAGAIILGIPIAFLAGIFVWMKDSSQARFYLVAWSFFLFSALIYALKMVAVIPSWKIFDYGMQIGGVVEVVLLALGLADRINTLKSEALAASESSSRIKDEFMSTITHELLTPMNGIKLSLSLLDSEVKSQEGKQVLKTANDSSIHLLNLIESMFTFVQARQGSFSLKKTTFNIKKTLQNVFDYFDTTQFNNDLRLTLDLGNELPEWVVGDEKKISLVVVQLMKNACSFTHKGEVTLLCEAVTHADNVEAFRFSVKDTGAGISKEKQAEIFVAFNQVDNSINRVHGGMGIGLTIVNDLLSLMSAKLSLVSELGKGATFSFEIPIKRASEIEIAQVIKEKTNVIHHLDVDHSKILVVEDNPVNMKLLCKVLEKSNYQPLSAIHGEEALVVLEKNPDISAILMDCQMPVMDGFQATREIRNLPQYSHLPIIAVTANVSEEDQQRCRDVGMSDYLSKPVKKTQIESMLIKWLEKAEQVA